MYVSLRGIFFIFLIILATGCQQNKPLPERRISLSTAKLVSQAPLSLIQPDEPVRIRFNRELVNDAEIGKTLKSDILRFEPPIKGTLRWLDKNTLSFKPEHFWTQRQQYQGRLDLSNFLPEAAPFQFMFNVAGREVQNFTADFIPAEANKPQKLVYTGTLVFTVPADPTIVKQTVRLTVKGEKTTLSWKVSDDHKQYKFRSSPLRRGARATSGRFFVPSEALNLSAPFSRQLTVPPLQELTVINVFIESAATRPAIKIHFSDRLAPQQDLRGLISFTPPLPVKLKIIGADVLVQAPFEYGQKYALRIHAGIRSRLGNRTDHLIEKEIVFADIAPDMRFSNDGVFLTSGNNKSIMFQTVNLRRVHLKIIKVFATNLGQFLQSARLNGARQRRNNFGYELDRVGLPVAEKDLFIGAVRNRWLQHQLDLTPLIAQDAKGLYLLKISFTREDMLYNPAPSNSHYQRRYDYYDDPAGYGYVYSHGRLYKPVIVSDIGLTYKQSKKEHIVFCTNLITTNPLAGVTVRLRSYQNQILAEGRSDKNGLVHFADIEGRVFYVEAQKDAQRSVVKVNEMSWNLSTFDTKGVKAPDDGLQAYIYTERGVYRPGDTVHVAVILRNAQHSFPENHPVQFDLTNPRRQIVYSTVSHAGHDGFYVFRFATQPQDVTGNYQAVITAGSQKFFHRIKIETIVPERLKVQLSPQQYHLDAKQKQLNLNVHSTYLFGRPAAGLETHAEVVYLLSPPKIHRFKEFSFRNQSKPFDAISQDLYSGRLNNRGEALIRKRLPDFTGVPSRLKGHITVSVLEKSGRAVRRNATLTIDPYAYYVGIKAPQARYGALRTGNETQIPVVLVDSSGQTRAGHTLRYRIYLNERHWWWEYESRNDFQLRFKQDRGSKIVARGTIVSGNRPLPIKFTPQKRGQYMVEVQNMDDHGHSATVFFYASAWGQEKGGKNAGVLVLRSNKDSYAPGETADIFFPAAQNAVILFTLEKGQHILQQRRINVQKEQKEQRISVVLSQEMAPNVYASVSVIQPQGQKSNDRPMRMYGLLPLKVVDPHTQQKILLHTPKEIKPGHTFSVTIQNKKRQATQYTVAVVDEGLLSLTHFPSPDPWKAFFRKQRLEILTSDLYSQVIGVNRGDIFRTFSIGGDLEEADYRRQQLTQQHARRFKPVCLFKGPLNSDAEGRARVTFTMPQYVGAVRIMVVSANHNRYGSAWQTVPVRKNLMMLPTLPRFLAPGDEFILPVTVFASDKIKQVTVNLKLSAPLHCLSDTNQIIHLNGAGQKEVYFRLKAAHAVGTAKIVLQARSANKKALYQCALAVRSAAPRIRDRQSKALQPGQQVTLLLPNRGLPGSNRAVITVQRRPKLNLDHRIYWLIRYPYGCLEQTVSAVFPQLYLQAFIPNSPAAAGDIDENINEALARLPKFQLASGAFSYWPGAQKVSAWSNLYAGHFLIEARQSGYHVADKLFKGWLEYTRSQARLGQGELMIRVYRAYLLALAGHPSFSAMNLLKENQLTQMSDVQRWLLAGAYQLSGAGQSAAFILKRSGKTVADYKKTDATFGSALRDKALILEMLRLFKRWEEAAQIADILVDALSAENWYSTQSSAFMLLALGKYFRDLEGTPEGQKRLVGEILLPDGKRIPFDTQKIAFSQAVKGGFGQNVTVKLASATTVKRAFVTVDWSGLPLQFKGQDLASNLKLHVRWLDEDGLPMDISRLKQGTAFYGHFSVRKLSSGYDLNELALLQLLPAGWEIEQRLPTEEQGPQWITKFNLGNETYHDLRDDRAMWFFDLPGQRDKIDFLLRLNAVTAGTFRLPPTVAEAMYNNRYHAQVQGRNVRVMERTP